LAASATRLDVFIDPPLEINSWPDGFVLVRWWVNGAPVRPKAASGFSSNGGHVIPTRHLIFLLRGAMTALGAHPGDRITVQVLVCPEQDWEEWDPEMKGHFLHQEGERWDPAMSERVEFTLPSLPAR
jgi:hypothetical protein